MVEANNAATGGGGRRAIFLDRDGTIIVDSGYLCDPAGVELLPGAVAGLRRMQALGLALVVVTNQSGIGRGYYDRAAADRVGQRLDDLLAAEGVRLDGVYICPHAPQDGCACRKPRPGLVEQASRELGLEPAASFVIGDKACDIGLGEAVGATTILVTTGSGETTRAAGDCRPDHVATGLDAAAAIIETLVSGGAS